MLRQRSLTTQVSRRVIANLSQGQMQVMQSPDDDEILARADRRNKMIAERVRLLNSQIFDWAAHFEGRLLKERLDDALLYVTHGERRLAIETLIDYLSEDDIAVTQAEYEEAKALFTMMSMSEDGLRLLADLVR